MIANDLLGAIIVESAGHQAGPDSATPSDGFHDDEYILETTATGGISSS